MTVREQKRPWYGQYAVNGFAYAVSAIQIIPSSLESVMQKLIRTHNEAFPVVAMCVRNSDRSPVAINRMASSQRVMFSGAKHLQLLLENWEK